MIIVYAIRVKGTDLYLPAGRKKGFTWDDPLPAGGPNGPRLITSLAAAKGVLSHWLKGCVIHRTSGGGGFFSDEYEEWTEIIPPSKDAYPRIRENMEIVPLRLVPIDQEAITLKPRRTNDGTRNLEAQGGAAGTPH